MTRFLSRWEHIRHCLTPCSVADLGIGTTVDVIDTNAAMLRAFAIMHKLGVSALGVVEQREVEVPGVVSGRGARLAANTEPCRPGSSAASTCAASPRGTSTCAMRVGDFVRELHDVSASEARKPRRSRRRRARTRSSAARSATASSVRRLLVTCSADATLFDALKVLATHRVHRVYAVDDGGVARRRPHTDLVRFLRASRPPSRANVRGGRRRVGERRGPDVTDVFARDPSVSIDRSNRGLSKRRSVDSLPAFLPP